MKNYLLGLALTFSAPLYANDWFTEVAIGHAVVRHRNDLLPTEYAWRPQLRLGLTRNIDENWRLHTGLELLPEPGNDSNHRGNLLNCRIAELDYRVFDNWALSFFGGLAYHYRERPAYGYSVGIGSKYRLSEHWVLAADFTMTIADISTDVPGDSTIASKDRFEWLALSLKYGF